MHKSKLWLLIVLAIFIASGCFAASEALKKSRALRKEKKYEEALQVLKAGIKEEPSEELFIEAGSLLGKMQKYENAQTVLEKGLQIYPESTSLKNLLSLILIRRGEKAKALELLNQVLAADPTNGFAIKWLEKAKSGNTSDTDNTISGGSGSVEDDKEEAVITGAYKVDNSLSKEEQKELAKKLYEEMMQLEKWEIDSFKELHRKVIEKCPQTDQAEESCWRLSNLYLLAEDPPDYQGVIDVLEHLLRQYPETPLFPDAKNRLMIAYERSGQMDKLVGLYEELFTRDPEPIDDKVFMVRALGFANALRAVGRNADAQVWYQKVIEKDGGKNSLEARVAREKLAGN
ncbi:MAG: hypothetical protein Kow0029_01040 [Candidatus Rifleibacteriota bacterium]